MTAIELHNIIGELIAAILMAAAIVAALLYLVLLASGGFGTRSDDSDVIGSHLISADGKSWDFSKSQSDKARAQRTVSAYDDPKARGSVRAAKGEEVAIGLTGLFRSLSEPPGPDDEEEGGPDDVPEDAVIEFDTPDYSEAAPVVKTLKPKKQ
ncbi:MAG: hypothetical protein IPJ00_17320 [Saprospirales bacterium]|nr:hypothetical protein [Saprospirales bacterium]